MQVSSFNSELAYANLLFSRLFSNIKLERQGKNGKTESYIVDCAFGDRSRVLKGDQNSVRTGTLKLPAISICRTGITRQPGRLANLHNEVKHQMTSKYRSYDLYTPVPLDLTFDVSFMTKYPQDRDKLMSNFLIFFNSDVFVTCEHPKYKGLKFNNQIIMQDTINEEQDSVEIDGSTANVFITTFQFLYKTCIFGGNKQAKRTETKLSTVLSTYVHEFQNDDEILDYLKKNPHNKLSTTIEEEVETQVQVPSLSGEYSDFVPQINHIDVGFYGVPRQEDITEYMNYVDETFATPEQYDPFVDRLVWQIDHTSESEFPDNVAWYRKEQL